MAINFVLRLHYLRIGMPTRLLLHEGAVGGDALNQAGVRYDL